MTHWCDFVVRCGVIVQNGAFVCVCGAVRCDCPRWRWSSAFIGTAFSKYVFKTACTQYKGLNVCVCLSEMCVCVLVCVFGGGKTTQ